MLTKLSISNYALIDSLDISPSKNLNGITGETGAGKSIMLGAMGLLLGKRADTKVLLEEDRKCVVEGCFDVSAYNLSSFFEENDLDYDEQTIIRREITSAGKSRAFINDTPVTLDILKDLSTHLIDIHSQHDTLLLGDLKNQLKIVDLYAQNGELLEAYQSRYKSYKAIEKELKLLKENASEQGKELDYNRFLLEELVEAKLGEDSEQEELENELKVSENAEEIKSTLYQITQAGSQNEQSILSSLNGLKHQLRTIAKYSPDLDELAERMDSSSLELADLFSEIERKGEQIDFDPNRIEEVRNRLDVINGLQHKHKVSTISELIDIREKLGQQLVDIEQFDERLEDLEKQLNQSEELLSEASVKLSTSRAKCLPKLKQEIENLLSELSIPNASIEVSNETTDFSAQGTDQIEILFSANKGVAPQSLKQAASGGEFSRLMFVIKYLLADKTALPTIIFDEIDSGVSGEIAIKMGKMMGRMAKNHQVITITHLPQIAALAATHYFVYKDEQSTRTVSLIRELNSEEREVEIAKMISGDKPSEVAFQNARELLSLAAE